MKQWVTQIRAIDPRTGELKTWGGPHIAAPSWELAQQWCHEHCGYLEVIGELVAEIPCKKNSHEPDFNKMIDYEKQSLN